MFFKGKYPGGNLDASKEKGSKEKEALNLKREDARNKFEIVDSLS
jgi:hypothetical protein